MKCQQLNTAAEKLTLTETRANKQGNHKHGAPNKDHRQGITRRNSNTWLVIYMEHSLVRILEITMCGLTRSHQLRVEKWNAKWVEIHKERRGNQHKANPVKYNVRIGEIGIENSSFMSCSSRLWKAVRIIMKRLWSLEGFVYSGLIPCSYFVCSLTCPIS